MSDDAKPVTQAEIDAITTLAAVRDHVHPNHAKDGLVVAVDIIRRLAAERDRLKSLVVDFMDYEPCQYDHHGLCQAHTLHERPCPYEVAQKLFPKETQ